MKSYGPSSNRKLVVSNMEEVKKDQKVPIFKIKGEKTVIIFKLDKS